jgi:NADH-quinone oxidoreductase subunit N
VAWSGVAHSGYLLIPLLALNELSAPAIFYYTTAYAVASIGVFAVILSLGDTENEVPLERFKGLAKNNPLLTFALLTGMFSLAGIPPLAGFFGKYYLFANALSNGLIIVTVIAVIGSLVGIYYYFRPVIFAFNTDVPPVQKINNGFAFNFVLMLCIFLTLLLGLFPDILANLPF